MSKIKVSAVSYTNTLPFLQGIKASEKLLDQIELSVDVPAECARKVIQKEADMGIIPVAALTRIPEYYIITDYCIGSDGPVDSVFIFSSKPIEEIDSLRLDHQSRTSNGLARILLKYHWKHEVDVKMDGEADAYVLIGDRTFGQKERIPYVYDLGEIWKKFTGLPFAYAVWVSNKNLPDAFVADFNAALKDGVSHPTDVITGLKDYPNFDYKEYLTEYLDFNLDEKKREAISKYLELYKSLEEIDFKGV
ncbi:menaquinone biosynthetic enzyme MqnA/MqnD family protein [Sphingobacterium bovistauri]|uniref:Chorismate dehydratase n=1 Tax=Sphingobacterium bovistauri TaxID=2781959 RepID=A0ABS7Z887_9SPHI|nr:menaquinone biosynthesis protein [Sphingobacterium bovistauri]MCA5004904.1 menaquinone biosynthesis protein [Sphingobacterium bovistauri]